MPADDTLTIHPSTVHVDGVTYGCKDRAGFAPGYWMQARAYAPDGRFTTELRWVDNVMSPKCRSWQLWETDDCCRTCSAPRDLEYAAKWR